MLFVTVGKTEYVESGLIKQVGIQGLLSFLLDVYHRGYEAAICPRHWSTQASSLYEATVLSVRPTTRATAVGQSRFLVENRSRRETRGDMLLAGAV